MKVWMKDEKTGLLYGEDNFGNSVLCDQMNGGLIPDTPENREKLVREMELTDENIERSVICEWSPACFVKWRNALFIGFREYFICVH